MADTSGTLPAPDAIAQALDRVLARPEFNPPPESALDRLRHWLWEQWTAWWSAIRTLLDGVERVSVSWVVELVVIALAVVAVIVLWRRIRFRARRTRDVTPAATESLDVTAAARAQLATAASAAGAGRFLDAARALYLGVVLWLSAAGQLRFDESATGEEYARRLPRDGAGAAFRALLATFYPLAFGGRPATTDAYARMRAAANALGVPE